MPREEVALNPGLQVELHREVCRPVSQPHSWEQGAALCIDMSTNSHDASSHSRCLHLPTCGGSNLCRRSRCGTPLWAICPAWHVPWTMPGAQPHGDGHRPEPARYFCTKQDPTQIFDLLISSRGTALSAMNSWGTITHGNLISQTCVQSFHTKNCMLPAVFLCLHESHISRRENGRAAPHHELGVAVKFSAITMEGEGQQSLQIGLLLLDMFCTSTAEHLQSSVFQVRFQAAGLDGLCIREDPCNVPRTLAQLHHHDVPSWTSRTSGPLKLRKTHTHTLTHTCNGLSLVPGQDLHRQEHAGSRAGEAPALAPELLPRRCFPVEATRHP